MFAAVCVFTLFCLGTEVPRLSAGVRTYGRGPASKRNTASLVSDTFNAHVPSKSR